MNNELARDKEIVEVEKKLVDKMWQKEFVIEVRQMSESQLNVKKQELSDGLEEIKTSKANDEALKAAQEKVTELGAPYKEAKKIAEKKARFVHLVAKEEFGGE